MMDFDDITVRSLPMGRDLLIMITGGDAHIGAASTAYYEADKIKAQTSIVPGHKEHTLSEDMAIQAASSLKRTVTVVMGIHYDNLTKAEIIDISQITNTKFQQCLQKMMSEGTE